MKTHRIVRVEHTSIQADGVFVGPYNNDSEVGPLIDLSIFLSSEHRDDPLRPMWSQETWRHPQGAGELFASMANMAGYRAGFASQGDLEAWFDSSNRVRLHHEGFTVRTYDVPETNVLVGSRQCAYRPERARLVTTSPLATRPPGQVCQ